MPKMTASRDPLDPTALTALPAGWRVTAVAETASTNTELLSQVDAAEGSVLVAEYQIAGRGRLDRSWTSPPGAGLTFSVLLRPTVPLASWGWLSLMAGLSLVEAAEAVESLDADLVTNPADAGTDLGADGVGAATITGLPRLKWPNDLQIGEPALKAAGILVQTAQRAPLARGLAAGSSPRVVIGIGLNVSLTVDELPVPTATSLLLQGYPQLDRAVWLAAILDRLSIWYGRWVAAGGDAEVSGLAAAYRIACATLGTEVSVQLSDAVLTGRAIDVNAAGQLIVEPGDGSSPVAIAAGDVTHLRPLYR
ncbi:MAG: biotin/acetyl-CoA-carboxylase ligase [Frankiales bacterium]|nr:biotin/acetyl-CoA-carboxylase ligase [Frankiales bacterium]